MVDHDLVLGVCSSCHNGTTATGKNLGHFITQRECDYCHSTIAWVPDDMMHTTLAYEPLDHRGNFACTRCHENNSDTINWPSPGYQPDCAGCHAGDYRAGVDKHNGLNNDRNCASSGCHSMSEGEW